MTGERDRRGLQAGGAVGLFRDARRGRPLALYEYIASLKGSRLDALCKYAHHLKEQYSDQLTGMYVAELRDYAAKNMGRDHYRRMANAMCEMQKLNDGRESARMLADELRAKYNNRRAMKEELKEF